MDTIDELLQAEKELDFDDINISDISEKELKKVAKKKDNVIETSFLETEDYILEQIKDATLATLATSATDMKFIKYDTKTGSTSYITQQEYKGKIYVPIVDDLTKTGSIILPTGVEEYGTTDKLVEEISSFLYDNFEVDSFYESFLPYLALFYNVYDKFPFVPYLQFVGLTGTGKTTAMEVFGSICYKPIDASGSITMSPIFRIASKWRGTLLLDEFESAGDSYKEMVNFLKSGVSNKAVLRTEGDTKREVRAYLIKSPKIFTSENPISNAGLQSRTIVIRMRKNRRKIPLYRLGKFVKQAESLRNKILLWRLRTLNKIDLSKIEYGFPELSFLDRRVQQVITPIYYLSDDKTREKILAFAKHQQEETLKERRESLEGQIFQSISDHYPHVTISMIFEDINNGVSERMQVKPKKIANIVRKVFGFEIERMGHENESTLIINDEIYQELQMYYGTFISVADVASVASVANNQKSELSEEKTKEIFEI